SARSRGRSVPFPPAIRVGREPVCCLCRWKAQSFPRSSAVCIDCQPRRETQRRIFGTMENISQSVRSRRSQTVYDSREQLLIRRKQLAIAPRVANPRIEGQGTRNPDQYGTGLAPGPQPPSGCLGRVMEFSNRQESEKENDGN